MQNNYRPNGICYVMHIQSWREIITGSVGSDSGSNQHKTESFISQVKGELYHGTVKKGRKGWWWET